MYFCYLLCFNKCSLLFIGKQKVSYYLKLLASCLVDFPTVNIRKGMLRAVAPYIDCLLVLYRKA